MTRAVTFINCVFSTEPYQMILPIHTISESNQTGISKLAGILKARRIKAQRSETFYGLLSVWGRRRPTPPLTITLTRIAPRALDADNLAGSLKHVQDGVADWLCGEYGQGQDRQVGLTWAYAQRRGVPHEYAVEITIHLERIPLEVLA